MKKMMRTFLLTVLCLSSTLIYSKEPIANYQVLFSPEGHIADELIALIGKEKKSIKAAVYCLMHRGIVQALIDAHERGVQVEVIVDPFSVKSRSPVKKMGEANLPLFVWNPQLPVAENKNGKKVRKRKSLMHDKFCVLGNNQVWTGSFNFTFEASHSNRENVIVLENKEIASLYLEEFERMKRDGCQSFNDYLSQLK